MEEAIASYGEENRSCCSICVGLDFADLGFEGFGFAAWDGGLRM